MATKETEKEQALKQELAFYRSLEKSAVAGIFAIDLNGNQIYVNEAFCQMVGYGEHELLGPHPPYSYWPPEEEEKIRQAIQVTIQGKSPPEGFDLVFMKKGGERFPVHLLASPLTDKDGQQTGWITNVIDMTERRKMEEALRESEERFRKAFETAAIGKVIVSTDGRFLQVNPAFCKIVGYTEEELLTKTFKEITHPEDLETDLEQAQKLLRKETISYHLEKRYIRKDGQIVWILLSKALVLDAKGEPLYFLSEIQDITERKQVLESLRKSSEEIEDLYNRAPVGYHSLDKDGIFIRINDTELNWLGYSREEVLGKKKFSDLITPESLKTFQKNFPGFKERGYVNDLEFELVRKDSSILPILLSATAIKDSHGNYLMSRSTAYDMTARKQAEKELERQRALFQRIAETSPVSITIVDRNGQIIFANPQAEKILGLTKDEITHLTYNAPAWHITDFNGNPFPDEELPFRQVMTTRRSVYGVQHAIQWPDGKRVMLMINASPLLGETGEVEGMVAIIEDITERRQAEQARRQLAAIIEFSDDAVIGKNLDNIITSWNAGAERIYGYTAKESIGLPITLIVPEECMEELNQITEKIKQGLHVAHLETRRKRKDGSVIDVSLSTSPIKDEQGRIVGAATIARDVTRRKRLEEEIASARAEKERLEAIKNLSATFAHHIFNALAPVKGYAEMIQRKTDPADEKYEYATGIVRAVDESIVLVNKLKEIESYTPTQMGGMTFLDIEKKPEKD